MPMPKTPASPSANRRKKPAAAEKSGRLLTQDGPQFHPVRTQRAFEAVCDQIRHQIADRTLHPGQRIPGERELAEQFDISRSGVREALRSLELAGLVEARTGQSGGFFIKSGNTEGITQAVRDLVALGQVPLANVTEARIELTCMAIRLACQRATPADLDAIEADIDHHAELFRQGQGSRNSRSVGEFYRLLARATHNEVIVMLIDALSEIVRTLLMRLDPKPRSDIVRVRRLVLRHIRQGDAVKACATMTAHLKNINEYLEAAHRERAQSSTAARALAAARKRRITPVGSDTSPPGPLYR
jgi:GntR family transcriptional regulator, transcriptional repressor for pyruvate dehydrogenase complex